MKIKQKPITPSFCYPYHGALYLNITSRCPTACRFCIKYRWKYLYRSHLLLLKKEPSVKEMMLAVGDPSRYSEIVFCGYGESTYRTDFIVKVSALLRKKGAKKIRLNTNGFGNMIYGKDCVSKLAKALDAISISLNTTDPEEWIFLHRPQPRYRKKGFQNVLEFIKECSKKIPETFVTALNRPELNKKEFKKFVEKLGARARFRPALNDYEPS